MDGVSRPNAAPTNRPPPLIRGRVIRVVLLGLILMLLVANSGNKTRLHDGVHARLELDAADAPSPVDAVLARHGSYITRAAWEHGLGSALAVAVAIAEVTSIAVDPALLDAPPSGPPPPPVFFLTSARLTESLTITPEVLAAREERYATSIGFILSLGYHVLLSVASGGPGTEGEKWPLMEELAAAGGGQLRIHYCSGGAYYRGNAAKGMDELLCTQEAIPALLGSCPGLDTRAGKEPRTDGAGGGEGVEAVVAITPPPPLPAPPGGHPPPPPWCPHPDSFIIRMTGRYYLAKPHILLRAIRDNPHVGAVVKWGSNWAEPPPGPTVPQLCSFAFAMKAHELVRCYMRVLTTEEPWDGDLTPRNVRRYSIEALLAHCVLSLEAGFIDLPKLGIVANVDNGPTLLYY